MRTMIGVVLAASLFALCGVLSSHLYADGGTNAGFLGVPFALVCALLLVRKTPAFLIVPMIALLWVFARITATWAVMKTSDDYLPMGLAGLVGGCGIAVALGITYPHLLSRARLAGAAVIGFSAALSFGPWLESFRLHINSTPDPLQPMRLESAFAIWQAAVGTYVYLNAVVGRKRDSLK